MQTASTPSPKPQPRNANDARIIEDILAAGNRSERAFNELYRAYYHLVTTGRKKYPQLDYEDLISAYNTALIALQKQILNGTFRGDSSLSTYFTRIFINRCIDRIRQYNTNPFRCLEPIPESVDERADPLKDLLIREQMDAVMQALQKMSETKRAILMCTEYWGHSSAEVATIVGYGSADSVNSKKYLCMQQLRRLLAARFDLA